MHEYIQAPEQDIVISSRVRISRNFQDLPFEPKMTREYAEEVIERTAKTVFDTPSGSAFTLMRISEMEQDARSRLAEHHLISFELLKNEEYAAAMISKAGTVSVMLNEADHIRMQGLLPGLQLERAADMALKLDETLNDRYTMAFDPQLGYLSANPGNIGTGLRASVILHLPALTAAGQIGTVMQSIGKAGLVLRGLIRDGNDTRGQIYQLSNQATLGQSEEDIIRRLSLTVARIAENERVARENTEKQDMLQLRDTLMRSWGELMFAHLMSAGEFMKRYSDIRYAAGMGYLLAPIPALDLLMMDMQPGSLSVRAGHPMGERESEIYRAQMLRTELGKLVTN